MDHLSLDSGKNSRLCGVALMASTAQGQAATPERGGDHADTEAGTGSTGAKDVAKRTIAVSLITVATRIWLCKKHATRATIARHEPPGP